MKTKLIAICLLLSAICLSAFAQGTAFTYQGGLKDGGNLATGAWVNYGGIVGDNGTIKTVTNSPPTGTLFFRLSILKV